MKGLAGILEEHVGGGPQQVVFGRAAGAAAAPAAVPKLDVDRMTAQLTAQSSFNNRLIIVIFAGYLAILGAVTVLIFTFHSPKVILAALGGNLLTLASSVGFLRDLWREKNYVDMLLAVLPSLSSEEAMKLLRTFYLEKIAPKGAPRRRAAAPAPAE